MRFDSMSNAVQASVAHALLRDFRGLASRLRSNRDVPYTSICESMTKKDKLISDLEARVATQDATIVDLQSRIANHVATKDDEAIRDVVALAVSGPKGKRVLFGEAGVDEEENDGGSKRQKR